MAPAEATKLSSMAFMQSQAEASAEFFLAQQSHNCNFNIDRLKKGPVDWRTIEGTGRLFTDHSFPADQTMLSWKEYPRTIGGLTKYLNWFKDFRRPKDLITATQSTGKKDQKLQVTLFGQQFESTQDLNSVSFEQGSVGDNYFLTMLAAFSEVKGFIPSLFEQKKYTNEGIFAIQVNVKGRQEHVTIDDLFPTFSNKVAFAKPTSDDGWWVPLLEKAYAKVNVNYETISSGTHSEAARFLSGAPARDFYCNTMPIDEVWNNLQIALKENFIVTAANFIDNNGLLAGFGFIVKSHHEVDGVRLLKLKNPWQDPEQKSKQQWTGKYNPKDKFWTAETEKQVGPLKDGEFVVSVEDFKDTFKYFTVVYYETGMHNSFVEKRNAVNKKVYKFNFQITDEELETGDEAKKENKPPAASNLMIAEDI